MRLFTDACINFSRDSSKITVRGLSKNVRKMSEDVQKLLFELKEAIILSKRVVWKWTQPYNMFTPLPHRISRSIEMACQELVCANQKFLNYFAYFALNYFTVNLGHVFCFENDFSESYACKPYAEVGKLLSSSYIT